MRSLEDIRRDQVAQSPRPTRVELADLDVPFGTIFVIVLYVTISQVILVLIGGAAYLFVTRLLFP